MGCPPEILQVAFGILRNTEEAIGNFSPIAT